MKCIKVITNADFGIEPKPYSNPRMRFGARGVILNDEGKVGVLNKVAKNEYKLVGGGLEGDERPEEAFIRESLEESGCEVAIDDCLGTVLEERSNDDFMQVSFVYVAHVLNDTGQLHLTEKEAEEKSQILWLDLEEALAKIKGCEKELKPSEYEDVYHTSFVVRRDYTILKYYAEMTRQ